MRSWPTNAWACPTTIRRSAKSWPNWPPSRSKRATRSDLQPCVSPIWDTAIVVNALIDSGHGRRTAPRCVRRAAEWLLSKQTTNSKVTGPVKVPNVEPGGWYFEMENEYYPDVDDTIMVMMGLYKAYCPNGNEHWTEAPEPDVRDRDAQGPGLGLRHAEQRWRMGQLRQRQQQDAVSSMCLTRTTTRCSIPSSADITARTLEMCSYYQHRASSDPRVRRAIELSLSRAGRGWLLVWALGRQLSLRHLAGVAGSGPCIGEDMKCRAHSSVQRALAPLRAERGRRLGRDLRSPMCPDHPKAEWSLHSPPKLPGL